MLSADEARLRSGDVHGHVASHFCSAIALLVRHQLDHHADLSAGVNVDADRRAGRGFEALEAAHGNVLADLGDHVLRLMSDGLPVPRFVIQLFDSLRLARGDELGDVAGKLAELIGARDEVGLRVHFHENADVVGGVGLNGAFRGHAAGFLRRRGETLLAEDLRRLFHVAVGFGQRALDIHHARAGLFAQRLDHRCRDLSHSSLRDEFL